MRKDGTPFPVVVSVAPLEQNGETVGGVMEFRDVTKEKAAEEALREADRRKEEFLAVLSHELRNPLAPIQTALDLMRQAAMTGAEFERERAVMERQVRHLTSLVDDLLDVSRISRGRIELHKEVVDLAAVVAEAVEAVQPQMDRAASGTPDLAARGVDPAGGGPDEAGADPPEPVDQRRQVHGRRGADRADRRASRG